MPTTTSSTVQKILRHVFLLAVFFLFAVLIPGCFAGEKSKKESSAAFTSDAESIAPSPDPFIAWAQAEAASIAGSLDIRQLAAQLIMCGIDGRGHLNPDMRTLLAECPAGGVMLFRYNLDTSKEEIQNLISEISGCIAAHCEAPLSGIDGTQAGSGGGLPGRILPFVAVDHEGGQVNRFRDGFAALPPPGSYGTLAEGSHDSAIAQIEADSFCAGSEIYSLGINVNLAPVPEFLNAHNGEFLGSRSYGPNPVFTAQAASAFIRGMERAGLLCVAKHFPCSAGKDPHFFSSVLDISLDELDALISPFAALLSAGQARALMAGHTLVPARDPVQIASLSPIILNDWLRDELGFSGILICDDFSMAAAGSAAVSNKVAISNTVAVSNAAPPDSALAATKSLAAGADMVMVWPQDIRRTHRAIQNSIADGSLPIERLREAAARIIFEKIRMGLITGFHTALSNE